MLNCVETVAKLQLPPIFAFNRLRFYAISRQLYNFESFQTIPINFYYKKVHLIFGFAAANEKACLGYLYSTGQKAKGLKNS